MASYFHASPMGSPCAGKPDFEPISAQNQYLENFTELQH